MPPVRSMPGDMDMARWAGEGVVKGEPLLERWSPSERV